MVCVYLCISVWRQSASYLKSSNDGNNVSQSIWPVYVKKSLQRVWSDVCVPSKHKTFVQSWTSVDEVGPTLHKCYTNVLCLLGTGVYIRTVITNRQSFGNNDFHHFT